MFVSGFTRMFENYNALFMTMVKCYRRCALLIKHVIKFTGSGTVALRSRVLVFQVFTVNRLLFVINLLTAQCFIRFN